MGRFYPFKIELDGCSYSGEWSLLMGYRVCVRPRGYPSEIADIGRGTPEAAAARTLAKIVRAEEKKRAAEQKRREREVARVHRYFDKLYGRDDHA